MKMLKIAQVKNQEMFDTFDLENKIYRSFIRHYNEFIRGKSNKLQKEFEQNKSIAIGSSLLGNALDPIKQKYGEPKTPFPKKINFILMHPSHPLAPKDSHLFFMFQEGIFSIGKVLDNVFNFKEDPDLIYSMGHEIQHFLDSFYRETIQYPVGKNTEQYLNDPSEIQGHSYAIAKKLMNTISDVYGFRIQNAPDKSQVLNKLQQEEQHIVNSFVYRKIDEFFKAVENKTKYVMPENLRQTYSMTVIANFKRLFNQFIQEKRNELV